MDTLNLVLVQEKKNNVGGTPVVQALARALHGVLGQEYLSSSRFSCINGYWQIYCWG